MKNFIEVTSAVTGKKAIVNIEHIEFVTCEKNSDTCKVSMDYTLPRDRCCGNIPVEIKVKESYSHVKALIAQAQGEEVAEPMPQEPKELKFLDYSVEDIEFTYRTENCLKNADIRTVGKLMNTPKSELEKIRNMGKKSISEIKQKLKEYLAIEGVEWEMK